jgi:hypothetical protein
VPGEPGLSSKTLVRRRRKRRRGGGAAGAAGDVFSVLPWGLQRFPVVSTGLIFQTRPTPGSRERVSAAVGQFLSHTRLSN